MHKPIIDLQRPLVFLSIESTGLDVEIDRVVEIAMIKLDPGRKVDLQMSIRINPIVSIPPEATAIHGITNSDVEGCPLFSWVAEDFQGFAAGCDLAGYNIRRFGLPLLQAEFKRCELEFPAPGTRVIDVMRLFHKHERRDLAGAVEFFLNRPLKKENGALGDAAAAGQVLAEMIVRYDLPTDVAALEACACGEDATLDGKFKWSTRADGRDVIIFDFGKYKGYSLEDVTAADKDYLRWMYEAGFAADVKALLEKAAAGRLHEVRRPPQQKQAPVSKATVHSATRLLDAAVSLASKASQQLADLSQQQQGAALPSGLADKASALQQLGRKIRHTVNKTDDLCDKLKKGLSVTDAPQGSAADGSVQGAGLQGKQNEA